MGFVYINAQTCRYIGGIWNEELKDCSLYRVTIDDAQVMAEDRFARILNKNELLMVRKGVESGLGEGLDVVLDTAIREALKSKDE